MATPNEILSSVLAKATKATTSAITDKNILSRIEYVCSCLSNRAGVRLLMSSMLAKLDNPKLDPRKPYTNIGGSDSFSGRTYDERYLTAFISANNLPCNNTTAFLTPTLRNHDSMLTTKTELIGRPVELYKYTLQLLDDVQQGKETAENVMVETLRILLRIRNEKGARMQTLLSGLKHGEDALPLSSEAIVTLLKQHLACKHSSRLPVLIVAAAYATVSKQLGEIAIPLKGHNSADEQTGAMGDVEICLQSDKNVVTIYEMKAKLVTREDIDHALTKIASSKTRIHNYVFITTDRIDVAVAEYAAEMYEETHGTEIVVLDCIGFARHFLHLFHRMRTDFLNRYQELVLKEPDSAVSQPLKEAFLSLRTAAESDE